MAASIRAQIFKEGFRIVFGIFFIATACKLRALSHAMGIDEEAALNFDLIIFIIATTFL